MKAILFDVDDTLYDQVELFGRAYHVLFGNRFDLDIRELFKARTRRSDEVFELSQSGKMPMEDMYIYRVQKAFEDLGERVTEEEALRFQEVYEAEQKRITVSETIAAVLDQCRLHGVPTGVITNGPSAHQWNKVNALELMRWMPKEHIIVSGDCGIMKPDKGIFDYARKRMNLQEAECWFVGDSYLNDVVGAKRAGWKTIWLKKRDYDTAGETCLPDHCVESEEELRDLIGKLIL